MIILYDTIMYTSLVFMQFADSLGFQFRLGFQFVALWIFRAYADLCTMKTMKFEFNEQSSISVSSLKPFRHEFVVHSCAVLFSCCLPQNRCRSHRSIFFDFLRRFLVVSNSQVATESDIGQLCLNTNLLQRKKPKFSTTRY